nr:Mut7-C ubiquitin/RNAse domain-containing protein [Pedobacter sp. SYSU D00535]
MPTASFCFYDSLNDFLPASARERWLDYPFLHTQSVKDIIEAIGVPHPEIGFILLNGSPVAFEARVREADRVEVYPVHKTFGFDSILFSPPQVYQFVLDVHLGKLARLMRLLGFDTLYTNTYTDAEIVAIAERENRIVLTRDVGLLKQKSVKWGYWLRSQNTREQLQEVIAYWQLKAAFREFERCLQCNGKLQPVDKQQVLHKLPPKTREFFQEFFQCRCCQKVYWKGSHYDRMQALVRELRSL